MRRRHRSFLALLCLVTAVSSIGPATSQAASPVRVKMATMAPDGSAWHKALEQMGSEWRRATDGVVELRIYPGGTAGDEAAVVRKMRIGQLDAAGITIVGLAEVDAAFDAFGIPMLFRSYEELRAVLDEVEPYFEQKLSEKGFVLLNWANGGWAHLFSDEPIRTIDELKRAKLYVSAGDDDLVEWWKDNGFKPRALAPTDILTGLETGMIDAMVTTPLVAMSMQWFKRVPHMHHLPLGPLVGANVMTKRTWESIEPAARQRLLAAAEESEKEIFDKIAADDQEAVELMKQRGLKVVESADEGEWRRQLERYAAEMRGELVPAEAYDRVTRARDQVRRASEGSDA